MAHIARHKPSKIFRGTVDEVFSHRSEIPAGARVELKIFEPDPQLGDSGEAQTARESDANTKKLRGYGMLAGLTSVDDFLRRKHEETLREDQSISDRSRS